MSGWLRSTPKEAHAAANFLYASWPLTSDSSFIGSCSGPSGPHRMSGPGRVLHVSPVQVKGTGVMGCRAERGGHEGGGAGTDALGYGRLGIGTPWDMERRRTDGSHADGAGAGGRRGADHQARGEGTGDREPAAWHAARVSHTRGSREARMRKDGTGNATRPRRQERVSRAGGARRLAVAAACACERACRFRARRPCRRPQPA